MVPTYISIGAGSSTAGCPEGETLNSSPMPKYGFVGAAVAIEMRAETSVYFMIVLPCKLCEEDELVVGIGVESQRKKAVSQRVYLKDLGCSSFLGCPVDLYGMNLEMR